MAINRNHIASIFAIGAATVAIGAAPTASAAAIPTAQSCSAVGDGGSECQSPGNVQINDSPPPVENYDPYGPFFLGLGGYGHHGGGGHR